ncbi:glycosyltransferase family 4 protein [Novosphingobium aquiterrae]|uniref:Glycosyltransferase family 4 protein n=1 Tax=Novosphingobium aquiterrae TaxID=624388 RepID=A0ABV6PFR5_9SPHN
MTHRPRIAFVWAQFGPYHADRLIAAARRFEGKADLLAVEIAEASHTYAWKPVRELDGVPRQTLFPGQRVEDIGSLRLVLRMFACLRKCDYVFMGVGYGDPAGAMLPWLLRLVGVRTVLMFDSKHDDSPRRRPLELLKRILVWPHRAAIVGGRRHIAYARSLGFRKRPVLPCCDGVSLERIRAEAGRSDGAADLPFAARDFIFVGRFVDKKNMLRLVDAFAQYCRQAGAGSHRLKLAGSGALEPAIRARIAELGIAEKVDFLGFLDSQGVSQALDRSLALVLPSTCEQWGLVVNEALALRLPAIVSQFVGARDLLVRQPHNGLVVDALDVAGLADALLWMAEDEQRWEQMRLASDALAWRGDCARLIDAVEVLVFGDDVAATNRLSELQEAVREPFD